MVSLLYGPDLQLPWSSGEEEDSRFAKLLRNALMVFLLFAVAVPFLPVPEISREKQEALPP